MEITDPKNFVLDAINKARKDGFNRIAFGLRYHAGQGPSGMWLFTDCGPNGENEPVCIAAGRTLEEAYGDALHFIGTRELARGGFITVKNHPVDTKDEA